MARKRYKDGLLCCRACGGTERFPRRPNGKLGACKGCYSRKGKVAKAGRVEQLAIDAEEEAKWGAAMVERLSKPCPVCETPTMRGNPEGLCDKCHAPIAGVFPQIFSERTVKDENGEDAKSPYIGEAPWIEDRPEGSTPFLNLLEEHKAEAAVMATPEVLARAERVRLARAEEQRIEEEDRRLYSEWCSWQRKDDWKRRYRKAGKEPVPFTPEEQAKVDAPAPAKRFCRIDMEGNLTVS